MIPEYRGPRGPVEGQERQPLGGMPADFGGPSRTIGWQGGFRGFEEQPGRSDAQTTRQPRYWTDDEWDPARFSPERIAALQRDLASAGLIDANDRVTWGVWDPTSASAYAKLLGYANATGLDAEKALTLYAAQPEPETTRQPLVKRLSNPADLRTAIKETLTRVAGEAPPEKVEQMIRAYQGQEGAVQQQAYNLDETGGTVVDPPSVQGFVEDQARREMPVETAGVDVVEDLNALNQWLGFE